MSFFSVHMRLWPTEGGTQSRLPSNKQIADASPAGSITTEEQIRLGREASGAYVESNQSPYPPNSSGQ